MRVDLGTMRRRRGWSQAELSRRSGVPQPMISEIESGVVSDPRIRTISKLANALRCAIEDLCVEDREEGTG